MGSPDHHPHKDKINQGAEQIKLNRCDPGKYNWSMRINLARVLIAIVTLANLQAAIVFLLWPERYTQLTWIFRTFNCSGGWLERVCRLEITSKSK
jgi:hypothetical protein